MQGMKKGFKTAVESSKAVMFNDRENEMLRQVRRACTALSHGVAATAVL